MVRNRKKDREMQDPLPPDHIMTSTGYFLDVAQDDRLVSLLDAASRITETVQVSGHSLNVVDTELFPPNSFEEGQQTTALEHIGVWSLKRKIRPNGLIVPVRESYGFSLRSLDGPYNKVNFALNDDYSFTVRDQPKTFAVPRTGLEVAQLALRTGDITQKIGDIFGDPNAKEYIPIIRRIWRMLAEDVPGGTITSDHFIKTDSVDEETGEPTEIRFGYKQVNPDVSPDETRLTLEIARVYKELDAEDVYRLELTLNDVSIKPRQVASHVRRGKVPTVTATRSIHEFVDGRKEELDTVRDPEEMVRFVDAFETLLERYA
jgi:hypothetical protein